MYYRSNPSLIFLLLLVFVAISVPLYIANAQTPASEVVRDAQSLSDEEKRQACERDQSKCESEEESEIVSEESTDENGGVDLGLGEFVNADFLTQEWQNRIQGYLEEYNLSASGLGQLLASLIVLILAGIFVFVGKKLLHKSLRRLRQSKIGFQISLKRMHLYRKAASIFFSLVLLCLIVMALMMIWSARAEELYLYSMAASGFRLLLTFAFLFALAAAAFETVSAVMEHYLTKWSHSGSARVHTLLPIVRNVANCVLLVIFGITLISELGINIMPLLAGAGVIGFAVGFGAQTIIKDLITGFIIIFEDLVQVGDVVSVGGKGGFVEKITIRKIQLRGLDGVVYTVPYSEISVIENMTKEFSYYLFNVGVAYRESPDEVIEVLKGIGKEMQEDERYRDKILEPLEVLGVDSFADSAVVIKARIKTLPIKQWEIGREFNRRMKYRFDEQGIEIPFPHQTLYFGEDKNGDAPTAKIELKNNKPAANDNVGIAGQ